MLTKATFLLPLADEFVYDPVVRQQDHERYGVDIDDAIHAVLKDLADDGTTAIDELQCVIEDYIYQPIRDIADADMDPALQQNWVNRHTEAMRRMTDLLTLADIYLSSYMGNIIAAGRPVRLDKMTIVDDAYHVHYFVEPTQSMDIPGYSQRVASRKQYIGRRPIKEL
jgi:hypothetical protein